MLRIGLGLSPCYYFSLGLVLSLELVLGLGICLGS